jgi:hypothetical protein
MEIDLGVWLVIIRSVALLVIAILLGRFHDPQARFKFGVSLMAIGLAGGSFGWALYSLITIGQLRTTDLGGSALSTAFVIMVMIPVIQSRGNAARMLPRKTTLHRG